MTTSRLSFLSTNGTIYPLDGSDGIFIVDLADGLFTVPTDLVIDQRVGADGGVLVTSRRSPRSVLLSFMVVDPADAVQMSKWAALMSALAIGGSLIFDGPNGVRTLTQVVLESSTRSGWAMGEDDTMNVSLIALDPWWYGDGVTASGTFGSPTAWNAAIPWDSAIPWDGGSSTTITNVGDVPTWVTVVVTGAASTVSMSVNGVGGWTIDTAIASSAYMSVSGEPGHRGPHTGPSGLFVGTDGPVDWGLVTEGSQLFDLPTGSSSLVFGATGTDGNTAWTLFWVPRYLTP